MNKQKRRNNWLNNNRWRGGDLTGAPSILATDHNQPKPPQHSFVSHTQSTVTPSQLKGPVLDLISPGRRERQTQASQPPTEPEKLPEPEPLPEAIAEEAAPTTETDLPKPEGERQMTVAVAEEAALEPVADAPENTGAPVVAGQGNERFKIIGIEVPRQNKVMNPEETVGYKVAVHRLERKMNEEQLAKATRDALKNKPKELDALTIKKWENNQEIIPEEYIDTLINILIRENDSIGDGHKGTKAREFREAYEASKKAGVNKDKANVLGEMLFKLRQNVNGENIGEGTLAGLVNRAPKVEITEPLASIDDMLIMRIEKGIHIPSQGLLLGIMKGLATKKAISSQEAQDLTKALKETGGTVSFSNRLEKSRPPRIVDHSISLEDLRKDILTMMGNPSLEAIAKKTQVPSTQVGRMLGTNQTYLPNISIEMLLEYSRKIGTKASAFQLKGEDKLLLEKKLELLVYRICELRGTPLESIPRLIQEARDAAASAPAPVTIAAPVPAPAPVRAVAAVAAAPVAEPAPTPEPAPAASSADTPAAEPTPAVVPEPEEKPAPAPAAAKPTPENGEHAALIKKVNALVSEYNTKQRKPADFVDAQLISLRRTISDMFAIKNPAITMTGMASALTDIRQTDIRFTFEGNRAGDKREAVPADGFTADKIASLCSTFQNTFSARTPYDENLSSAFNKACDHLQELIRKKRELTQQQAPQPQQQ